MKNILIFDSHVLFRQGLVSLLNNQGDFCVVGEASAPSEAIERCIQLKPDLLLVSLDSVDGEELEAVNTILDRCPEMKIVILSNQMTDDLLFAAIRIGVKGFLSKNTPLTKLLASLRAIQRGEAAFSRQMTGRIIEEFARLVRIAHPENHHRHRLEALTSRELDVLKHLATGVANREIADRLYISENTVKVHVRNILEKLQLQNRSEAGKFARRQGLLVSDGKFIYYKRKAI